MEGFALHVAESFEAMGYTVERFEEGANIRQVTSVYRKRFYQIRDAFRSTAFQIPQFRWRRNRRLHDFAGRRSIDLTLVCHDFLYPSEVERLKEITGAPVVLWFPDTFMNFGRSYFISSRYDALFFKDPYIVVALRRVFKRPVFYLPECCNPVYHRPVDIRPGDLDVYGCDITTAGNLHPYRVEFFRNLIGYHVKIWGNPPPLWLDVSDVRPMIQNRFVANEEKSRAFRCAKIVLNNLSPSEIWGVNVRTFEVAGAGGFQLVDWRPGLAQLFDEGKELVPFTDLDDLKRKIDHYLGRDDERQEIAHSASIRAHRDHTYERRLVLLFETVFNGAKGFPLPPFNG